MHSKWKIWDFLAARPKVLNNKVQIFCLQSFDSFILKILKERIDYSLFEEKKLHIKMGKEVTSSWIEDNLIAMNLFGTQESYLVHSADDLSEDAFSLIFEDESTSFDGRFLIFNFEKDSSNLKKLKKIKSEKFELITIERPAFWEEMEMVNFFSNYFKVYLSAAAIDFVRTRVNFDFTVYYNLFRNIQLHFGDKLDISRDEVGSLIDDLKIDQFELVELLGTKRFKHFYKKFVEVIDDGQDIIQLMYFIQSHLSKVFDSSFLEGKAKLTKYDRQIMAHEKIWNKDDIVRVLNFFSDLIILAKKKDNKLELLAKSKHLKTLNI